MRNAKLWSVLCAAVLLALCIVGVLFTGASASETRIPEATATYVVGTDGDTIRACIEKAATQTWGKDDVLKIQFSGTDSSAYAAPDAANGVSGYTLFEVTTVFRADNTKLPIVIEGTDADNAATLTFGQNDYAATNDYHFTSLTIGGGKDKKPVRIFAGCGELVFENTKHNNSSYTYYFGDNNATDTFEGWDADKLAANVNEEGLLVTGITFGEGVTGLYQSGSSGVHVAAVGYDGNATCNPVLYALKRTAADVTTILTDDEVQAVKDAAPLATYKQGNVVATADCVVKPWNTEAYIVLDCGEVADKNDTTPDYPTSGPRFGVMPVRKATLTQLSGGNQYLSAGDAASGTNEVYVGDTYLIFRGGRSGEKMAVAGYSDVGIRLSQKSQYVGNLTFEVHEDDPAMPTYTPWVQCSSDTTTSRIFGDYHFLMTGGEIGRGHNVYNGTTRIYNDGNDGYWGAPLATGSTVNEVRGGQIWAFYGSRYSNKYENTTVSTVLPGTGETLTAKVSIHNIISGGIIGGDKITGTGSKDVQTGTKGFFGQYKGTSDKAVKSVCNEITGGTIYAFNAGNSGHSSAPGDIYNFISGTAEQYPTFLSHFHGTTCTVTSDKVVNVIKGYPVFQNKAGEKLSIYGGCKNGTVENVTTYLGGMPVFDAFYGGVCGAAPAAGEEDNTCEGVAGSIHNIIALDYTETAIKNYIWGGNGYHTIAGVDGATESKGNSENRVSGSITMDVYSGHYGTLRAESACGNQDNVPITLNVYGGQWTSAFMAVNRTNNKGSSSLSKSVVTTNIYDGTFKVCYMGGQNARNQEFINNVYGGTFSGWFYGGGNVWAKKVTNNIYGGNFAGGFAGGGSACGSESVTNNIYGGIFDNGQNIMGAYSNPSTASNIYAAQTIDNNFYGGEFYKWVYCGSRDGTTGTITNHFYTGENSPVRDAENELYKYLDKDGKTTLAGGSYFHDQVVCGAGYTEGEIDTNYAEAINNTFEGGLWTKASGGFTNITIRAGMRWGVVGNVTNNFIKGDYFRFFGGCDYGRVTGTVTNNFGKELNEGEEEPVLTFSGYAFGGGNDNADFGGKIAAAKAAAEPTAVQKAWIAFSEAYGEDFNIGAGDIVNNVYYGSFHQFYGGSYGANDAAIYSDINTITNNVYGGTFDKLNDESTVFAGGCFRSAVIETGIINNVEGGVFNGNYYGGSVGIGTVSCPTITNTINGFTGNASANAQVYFGNGAPDFNGVVKTTVNDFDAKKSYVYGGSSNIHNQPEDAEYGIETTVNGGTFCGFWGLGGGSSCVYTGNVKTTVNGGTFNGYSSGMPNSLMGGPRNGTLIGNVELIVNGGTFTADIVGGTVWGSQTAACDTITGNVTTTIKGGTIADVYALSRYPAEDLKATGDVVLNVEQTAGKTLKLCGNITADSFTAIDEPVELGRKATLTVEKLNGTLNVKQVEGWIARDYVILPTGSAYTVAESGDCFGKYAADETIKVYGLGIDAAGATIILDTKLGARILFNKNEVDQIGSDFAVEAKLGETVLASASYEDLAEYRGYYSMIVCGIGITDYTEDFTVSGQASLVISMEDLVNMGKASWSGKWLELCNSLENFHNVYNLDQAGAYTPDAVSGEMTARRGDAGADIYSASASLLMTDAAGLRLNLILRKNPADLAVKVNGLTVENCATVTAEVIGGDTYYNAQIDLYFKAGAMEDQFEVTVSSADGTYMTYGDSVASLAYKLASDEGNENRDNAAALLVYIQKACACASAS